MPSTPSPKLQREKSAERRTRCQSDPKQRDQRRKKGIGTSYLAPFASPIAWCDRNDLKKSRKPYADDIEDPGTKEKVFKTRECIDFLKDLGYTVTAPRIDSVEFDTKYLLGMGLSKTRRKKKKKGGAARTRRGGRTRRS
jgi:hypothetical protein